MRRIYADYEAAKERVGAWDFEDLLLKLADLLDEHPEAVDRLRARFRSLTVDEYQDVNPLQQALLEHWTGPEQNICVVGDDYQTIYAFTGASPDWLLRFPERFPDATVVRLEESYRSTPPVLELANALVPPLGGFDKHLRATCRATGRTRRLAHCRRRRRGRYVVAGRAAARLKARAVEGDGGAVSHQRALGGLRGGARPQRECPTRCTTARSCGDRPTRRARPAAARRRHRTDVARAVVEVTDAIGYLLDGIGDDAGEEEATRQADLGGSERSRPSTRGWPATEHVSRASLPSSSTGSLQNARAGACSS